MRHSVFPTVIIPDELVAELTAAGWVDITESVANEQFPLVLYASPDGRFGLFIETDNAHDRDGGERPKYNVMSGKPQSSAPVASWWHGWTTDLIFHSDTADIIKWLQAGCPDRWDSDE
jgi:hypothetical protein